MLFQEDEKNKKYLIACGSSKLIKAQNGYSTTELELSAAVHEVKKCCYWLKGAPEVILRTDHRLLVVMSRKPLSEFNSEHLLRLYESISTYNFSCEYIKARMNNVGDASLRLPIE